MRFSIIVPVYNVEKYIAKCLDSIMKQTFGDFECLIIDDGSKDGSIDIAAKMIADDPRFVIHHKENGGLSDARNFGMDLAKGDYLFFVDSDDFLALDALKKLNDKIEAEDADIVMFDLIYYYEDGEEKVEKTFTLPAPTSFKENTEVFYQNHSANTKVYRHSFIKDFRFIKGMIFEDLASIPSLLVKAEKISYVPEGLYYYLQRSGSISHKVDPRIFDIYKAAENNRQFLLSRNIGLSLLNRLYLKDCLMGNIIRIKEFGSKENRLDYYRDNLDRLEKAFPDWYSHRGEIELSFKEKVVFFLTKKRMFKLLDWLYEH